MVIGCPNSETLLQPMDHIIVLSQWVEDKEKAEWTSEPGSEEVVGWVNPWLYTRPEDLANAERRGISLSSPARLSEARRITESGATRRSVERSVNNRGMNLWPRELYRTRQRLSEPLSSRDCITKGEWREQLDSTHSRE